jgi:hypothetical protein
MYLKNERTVATGRGVAYLIESRTGSAVCVQMQIGIAAKDFNFWNFLRDGNGRKCEKAEKRD